MARCEDYPCCGHEMGCCPNYDSAGRQLDMVCTCGARLPVTNRSSLCDSCLRYGSVDDDDVRYNYGQDDWDRAEEVWE
jgi:hypothetical protein